MSDSPVTNEVLSEQPLLTAGGMLRSAREAAGLHIAALAVSMKVSVKKLEALEQDRIDPSMEPVFVRALACSVCRALKIDPAPVLDKLPKNPTPRLSTHEVGKSAPFRPTTQAPTAFATNNVAKPAFFIVPVLLIGIVAVLFFPETKPSDALVDVPLAVHQQVTAPTNQDASIPAPAASDTAATVVTPAPETPVAPTNVVAPTTASPVPSPSVPLPVESKTVAERAPSVPGVMVFKAKAASWVEVVDGSAIVQVRRILNQGETVSVSGVLPLAVVVGRADAVNIDVRGKAFDLAPIARDGVARFEVK